MRLLSLNLLTVSVTAAILALLTLPAMALRADAPSAPELPLPAIRAFGVYVDPWHTDDWTAKVGAQPTIAAKFEAFSRRSLVDKFTNEAQRRGFRMLLISWEPWKPVPASLGVFRQSYPQRGYRNVDIANGSQDRYIRNVARTLGRFEGTVYLRYAHEMNGFWYPWSWDAKSYRRAWRRIVRIFRRVGAHNVQFVWSANPNLYDSKATWQRNLHLYWPGGRYVDAVGSTMINFGGTKRYSVSDFVPRLRALHARYGKPVIITEANTQYRGRVKWLGDFRRMLNVSPWISAVAWSQLPSRGAAQMLRPGDLQWDVQRDPCSSAILRGIIQDGLLAPTRLPAATPAPGSCDARASRPNRVVASRPQVTRPGAAGRRLSGL